MDLLAGEFYLDAQETYRWLRANGPVFYDEGNRMWGVASYDGVVTASRDAVRFSNAGGSRPDTGPLPWMIDLDGTDHLRRRRLVSSGFTPARVRATLPRLRALCDGLIDTVAEAGRCDFVADIAAPLPMVVIGDMLGVPAADHAQLLGWSRGMLSSLSGDPEAYAAAADAFGAYVDYSRRVIADRRANPTDDLFSVLVHARIDGEQLTEDEIVFESLLLLIGGDETTRQVTAGGLEQLLLHPDQLDAVREDAAILPSAVEEMLRWVSPIKNMARTTTVEVELCGVRIPAGEKVVLLYESANFDDAHFPEAGSFDVRRSPNEHLAFGFGPHFCLGASLARAELNAVFERVLTRMPDIRRETTDVLSRSITGIESMPVVFTPRGV